MEQIEQVVVAELYGRRRHQNHRLRVIAKVADGPVCPGLCVADVMRFVGDDQVEGRGWIELQQASLSSVALLSSAEEYFVEQRVRNNGLGVLLRPRAIEMRLFDTVTKCIPIEMHELFIEALQLLHPLAFCDQWFRAD